MIEIIILNTFKCHSNLLLFGLIFLLNFHTIVVVQSPDGYSFRGLIVQAYDPLNNQPIGSFSSGRGLKTIDSCSAVTHSDRKGIYNS